MSRQEWWLNVVLRIGWSSSTRWQTATTSGHNILTGSCVWRRLPGPAVAKSSSCSSASEVYWRSRTWPATRCYIPSFYSRRITRASICIELLRSSTSNNIKLSQCCWRRRTDGQTDFLSHTIYHWCDVTWPDLAWRHATLRDVTLPDVTWPDLT